MRNFEMKKVENLENLEKPPKTRVLKKCIFPHKKGGVDTKRGLKSRKLAVWGMKYIFSGFGKKGPPKMAPPPISDIPQNSIFDKNDE